MGRVVWGPSDAWGWFVWFFSGAFALAVTLLAQRWWGLEFAGTMIVLLTAHFIGSALANQIRGYYAVRGRVVLRSIGVDRLVSRRATEVDAQRHSIRLRAQIKNQTTGILRVRFELLSLELQGKTAEVGADQAWTLNDEEWSVPLPFVDGLVDGEAPGHLHCRISYGRGQDRLVHSDEWRCRLKGTVLADEAGRPDFRLSFFFDDVR
jgi:hypothetical protein